MFFCSNSKYSISICLFAFALLIDSQCPFPNQRFALFSFSILLSLALSCPQDQYMSGAEMLRVVRAKWIKESSNNNRRHFFSSNVQFVIHTAQSSVCGHLCASIGYSLAQAYSLIDFDDRNEYTQWENIPKGKSIKTRRAHTRHPNAKLLEDKIYVTKKANAKKEESVIKSAVGVSVFVSVCALQTRYEYNIFNVLFLSLYAI